MSDLVSQIMEFRTAYLQAVAQASVDREFRHVLTSSPDPLSVLREQFHYHCPWNLTLELRDNPDIGPRMNLANGTVMTRPYCGEAITIYLPDKPDSKDPVEVMNALAAYYHQNPWLLYGEKRPAPTAPQRAAAPQRPEEVVEGQKVKTTESLSVANRLLAPRWSSVNANPNPSVRFDLGACLADFISFSAAMFNALALAWEDAAFASLLVKEPHQSKQTVEILSQWLEYDYPWELDLIVQKDRTAKYNAKERRWENSTPPRLMLTIPWMSGARDAAEEVRANKANPKVAVMGLVLYNTDGPGYPFTCG